MFSQSVNGGSHYININLPKGKRNIKIPKSISRQGKLGILRYIKNLLLGENERRRKIKAKQTREKVKRLKAAVGRPRSEISKAEPTSNLLGTPATQVQQPNKIEYNVNIPGIEKLGDYLIEKHREKRQNIVSETPTIDASHQLLPDSKAEARETEKERKDGKEFKDKKDKEKKEKEEADKLQQQQYRDEVKKYLDHPDPNVRRTAKNYYGKYLDDKRMKMFRKYIADKEAGKQVSDLPDPLVDLSPGSNQQPDTTSKPYLLVPSAAAPSSVTTPHGGPIQVSAELTGKNPFEKFFGSLVNEEALRSYHPRDREALKRNIEEMRKKVYEYEKQHGATEDEAELRADVAANAAAKESKRPPGINTNLPVGSPSPSADKKDAVSAPPGTKGPGIHGIGMHIRGAGEVTPDSIKPISAKDLEVICEKIPGWRGIAMADTLTKIPWSNHLDNAVIFNKSKLSDNDGGTHWMAIHLSPVKDKSVELYDSLNQATNPDVLHQLTKVVDGLGLNYQLEFKKNPKRNQIIHKDGNSTNSCGYMAREFLVRRARGIPFDKASDLGSPNVAEKNLHGIESFTENKVSKDNN